MELSSLEVQQRLLKAREKYPRLRSTNKSKIPRVSLWKGCNLLLQNCWSKVSETFCFRACKVPRPTKAVFGLACCEQEVPSYLKFLSAINDHFSPVKQETFSRKFQEIRSVGRIMYEKQQQKFSYFYISYTNLRKFDNKSIFSGH